MDLPDGPYMVPQRELVSILSPHLICAFLPLVRSVVSLFHKISKLACTPAGTEGLCFDTALFAEIVASFNLFEKSKSFSGRRVVPRRQ